MNAAWTKFSKIPPHRNCISFQEKIQCPLQSVVILKFKIWGLHNLIPNSESTSLYQTAYSEDAASVVDNWWKIDKEKYTCDNLISKIQVMPCYNEYFNV